MHILVVEDERRLSQILRRGLEEESYAVDVAHDGEEGLAWAEVNEYDLIILDIMLPKLDGIEVCRRLRDQRVNTPIILLTARDTIEDKVRGLDSGADDYLTKPFAFKELLARIRSLLRRESLMKTPEFRVADLVLNTVTHEVSRGGRPIFLTNKEYALLEYFMRHPNRVLTREMIAEHVWDYDFMGLSNIVDVYVRYLRRKIDDPFEQKLIHTVRGAGYQLREPRK